VVMDDDRPLTEAQQTDDESYADRWRDAINETYTDADPETLLWPDHEDDEDWDVEDEVRRVLTKAAECLRDGATHTFTGPELDLVRHLMPAHEVHQSGAKRWVLEVCGPQTEEEAGTQ
jgi:hypothetical protein